MIKRTKQTGVAENCPERDRDRSGDKWKSCPQGRSQREFLSKPEMKRHNDDRRASRSYGETDPEREGAIAKHFLRRGDVADRALLGSLAENEC